MTTQTKKYRPAVFIVVYRKTKENKLEYIILKRHKHWKGWEFPKGGVEKGEALFAAAKRECYEETGIHAKSIKKFRVSGKYKYHKMLADRPNYIGQTYSLFACEVGKGKTKIDAREHSGYMWVSFPVALRKLKFGNQKKMFEDCE